MRTVWSVRPVSARLRYVRLLDAGGTAVGNGGGNDGGGPDDDEANEVDADSGANDDDDGDASGVDGEDFRRRERGRGASELASELKITPPSLPRSMTLMLRAVREQFRRLSAWMTGAKTGIRSRLFLGFLFFIFCLSVSLS